MDVNAQRRKDKDIPHLPSKDDKSKLREDRRKPKGLDRNDPDAKDVQKDPDLKQGGMHRRNLLVARSLVRMARGLVAYAFARKLFKVDGDRLFTKVEWNGRDDNEHLDFLEGYDVAADEMERLERDLKRTGVNRGFDDSTKPEGSRDRSFYMHSLDDGQESDDMVMVFDLPEEDGADYKAVLRRHGFKEA